jgi:hypothetical protein
MILRKRDRSSSKSPLVAKSLVEGSKGVGIGSKGSKRIKKFSGSKSPYSSMTINQSTNEASNMLNSYQK